MLFVPLLTTATNTTEWHNMAHLHIQGSYLVINKISMASKMYQYNFIYYIYRNDLLASTIVSQGL